MKSHYFINKKIGDCYRRLGEYPKKEELFLLAIEFYRKALRVRPESTQARTSLAIALSRADQFDEALREIKKIEDPDSLTHYSHARVYVFWWQKKEKKESNEFFERALEIYDECQNKTDDSWVPWCYYDEAALYVMRAGFDETPPDDGYKLKLQAISLLETGLKTARRIGSNYMHTKMQNSLLKDSDFSPIREPEDGSKRESDLKERFMKLIEN